MIRYQILSNVNSILVKPGLEENYIQFVEELNQYLKCKYGKYYIGMQLYQQKNISNIFYIVANYKNIPGLDVVMVKIAAEITSIYDRIWGVDVVRTTVFTFLNYNRII